MEGKKIQLIWYKIPEKFSKEYQWYFLMVGEKKLINSTRINLHNKLGYGVREKLLDFGRINNSKSFYELLCLESTNQEIDIPKVYEGDIKEDKRVSNGEWRDLVNFLYIVLLILL
jgi:hypothetical protein